MAEISAIPQQPQLGRLAQFLRYLETQNAPEFLPRQLDVMGLVRQLTLPQASTVENLSYGNLPFTMPPSGTGAMIPQVKTGRKPEVADLVGMLGGVPGGRAVMDVGTKLSNEAADAIVRTITRNPAATAPQVLQETAMPFMQAVAPRAPGLLETPAKSDLGFYSALEQATIPLQNKGTGAQFLAQIEKTAGVKPEEVKWTGLDEFLKSRQNVTKQEVQDYLAANRVNLQEVRLGGATSPYPYRTADEWQGAINRAEAAGNWDEAANLNQAWEAVEGFGPAGSPKFSQYTLPGGENYREILLTLPEKKPNTEALARLEDATKAYKQNASYENYQALNNARLEVGADWDKMPSAQYRSSHYPDQPNILAHMRVNDRVVDGKKTLFIEEIQSDWHQAGRKKGYGPQTETTVQAYYIGANGDKVPLGYGATKDEAAASLDPKWFNLVDVKFDSQTKKVGEGVPDAPFKTTWHELTLKRAIQEASEKGYDQIAFTTGKTQAERYDLSKQLESIQIVSPQKDSLKGTIFNGYRKGSNEVVNRLINTEDELVELVGKDVAEKLLKQQPKKGTGGNVGSSVKKLEGVELKIGGEGMKGFYDQILPKTLDKLGKKFDAKVSKTKLPSTQSKDDLAAKVYGRGETYNNLPSELKRKIDQMYIDDGVEVWQMDITPKMRESVLTKGQPLFAATPAIPAAGLLGDENE